MVIEIPEPRIARLLLADTRLGWVWLPVRLYVGYEWVSAGMAKVGSAAWTGDQAGAAIQGFAAGALSKSGGAHPDVSGWYAWFLQHVVIPQAALFGQVVAWGEVAVGLALIVGLFTGIAAFFGAFMNMNYLLAGTVSINPILFLGQLGLVLAWRIAGWIGLDRWTLPILGTPWHKIEVAKAGK
jgi:thiosulfate dehydrogenase [quinone] large subunit